MPRVSRRGFVRTTQGLEFDAIERGHGAVEATKGVDVGRVGHVVISQDRYAGCPNPHRSGSQHGEMSASAAQDRSERKLEYEMVELLWGWGLKCLYVWL